MNPAWSELNKAMQAQIRRRETWPEGLETLFRLRDELMGALLSLREELPRDAFHAMPFPRAQGYHSKTIAYSIWHIFRIEDIVANTLIADREQVFFAGGHQVRIHSPLTTTGNELAGEEIAAFSRQLDPDALYEYALEVRRGTEETLRHLAFGRLKTKPSEAQREKLEALGVVSSAEDARWLVDYWCGKDFRGLIQMPFSRHWIMHTEACLRIRDKLA